VRRQFTSRNERAIRVKIVTITFVEINSILVVLYSSYAIIVKRYGIAMQTRWTFFNYDYPQQKLGGRGQSTSLLVL
jgi:hypothetical protein